LFVTGAPARATDVRADLWTANGRVYAVAVDQTTSVSHPAGVLYVAGEFTEVGPADNPAAAVKRNYLAAIDLQSGEATEWNPNPDGFVRALSLSADGQFLYVGGDFSTIGGQFRSHIAVARTDTGVATNRWASGADGTVYTLLASARTSGSIFVGGSFNTILGGVRHGLAELSLGSGADQGGVIDSLQNVDIEGSPVAIQALALSGNHLYFGGTFSQVGGQLRFNAAAFDINTYDLLNWAPSPDGPVQALYVIPGRSTVYIGGSFQNVAGVAHPGIAALDPDDAHPLAWDPALRLSGATAGVAVRAMVSSLDRSLLYIGGDFDTVNAGSSALPRQRMAAIRASTAEAIDSWQVDADDTVRVLYSTETLLDITDRLYAGGDFTQINGGSRPHLVSMSALPHETQPPVTTASPAGGLLNSKTITPIVLTCDDGDGSGCAATYYTTDGTDPTAQSTLYTAPISIAASGVLKFFSVDNMGNQEAVKTEAYTIEITPPQTTANPASEVFFSSTLAITLTCADSESGCAATYYTTDGSRPTTQSTRYTGPVVLTDTTVLQFFSVDGAGNDEGVQRQEYVQNRGKVGAISPIDLLIGVAMAAARLVRRRGRND
jgi:hypothetical protein